MTSVARTVLLLVALTIGFHSVDAGLEAMAYDVPSAAADQGDAPRVAPHAVSGHGCHLVAHVPALTEQSDLFALTPNLTGLRATYSFRLHTFDSLPTTPPPIT